VGEREREKERNLFAVIKHNKTIQKNYGWLSVRHLPVRRWPPLLTRYYRYNERKKELTTQSQINKLSGLENVAVAQAQQTLNTKLQYVGSFDINSTIMIIKTVLRMQRLRLWRTKRSGTKTSHRTRVQFGLATQGPMW